MSKPTPDVASQIKPEHFEEALSSGSAPGMYGAIDPRSIATLAVKLAKLTPTILGVLTTAGVTIPTNIGAIVQLIVSLAEVFEKELA